jgi:hypothetical protein
MHARRTTALAAAMLCALVAPSHASQGVRLDGTKRTHTTIKASLTDPMLGNDRTVSVDPSPTLDDCASAASCDFTQIVVTGKPDGRFKATLTMTRDLNGAIALYDSRGRRVAEADMTNSCCNDGPLAFQSLTEWTVTFSAPRLPAGTYTFVIWDRNGIGDFVADLDYHANPPSRPKPKA